MAPIKPVDDKIIEVPQSLLEDMQKKMLDLETQAEENRGMIESLKDANTNDGEIKLREKKDFAPKFRTVKLRKYPVAGNYDDQDYIIGWTERGAYQEIDKNGITPIFVDMIEVMFLRNPKKAEKIKLLDIKNKGIQEWVKVVEIKKKEVVQSTGEEIEVSEWNPAHGLVLTGEKVDGMTKFSDNDYVLQIPGHPELVTINEQFLNL